MQSHSSSSAEQPPFLLLGRVLRPHGIQGELRILVLTAYPERIISKTRVYLGPDPQNTSSATTYEVIKVRQHHQYRILRLAGITSRNEAERLRRQYVMIPLEDAIPLEDDEFYLYQAIGLAVHTDEGVYLGQVSDIIETGANDVYLVKGPRGDVLLPAIDDCVLDIDIEAGTMTVHLMDGLLPD